MLKRAKQFQSNGRRVAIIGAGPAGLVSAKTMKESGFDDVRMLLQVHDELLFEAPEDQAEAAAKLVREVMEGAATLGVPLVAEAGIGGNWDEAH